jgi:hypothetical protein
MGKDKDAERVSPRDCIGDSGALRMSATLVADQRSATE